MRFRSTILVAILFVGLAGYLYFVEKPGQQAADEEKKLLHFKPDDVSEVTLTYPDKQIVIKKTAAGWHLQKPIDVDADETSVSNLVRAVADAEVKRTIDDASKSLEIYGLDKPEVIVGLTLANGKTLPAVRVGKTAPVGFSSYAQLEGSSEVKLLGSVFQTGMKKEVNDLRNKVIIDFKDEDVQTIDVSTPDSSVALARDGSDWKVEKPRALGADAIEVRSFLSSLRGIRAEDFVDEPGALANYGLDAPREKIAVVVGADKTRKELWIGAEQAKDSKKALYVKRADAPTVYAVGTWAWNGLNKNLAAFRDKTALKFDLASVATIEVNRRDGEAYRLVRDAPPAAAAAAAAEKTPEAPATPEKPSWKVDGAKGSKSEAIGALAADLHGLKGYEIAAENPGNLATYALAEPDLTFSVIDSTGKPIGRILASQVGTGKDANAYAMAEGGDVVLHVRAYLYSHLDKKKEDFVELVAASTPTVAPKK